MKDRLSLYGILSVSFFLWWGCCSGCGGFGNSGGGEGGGYYVLYITYTFICEHIKAE